MRGMFSENGVVETLQIVVWGVSALIAAHLAFRRRPLRDRVFGGWLAVVAALAVMRELDAHTMLNPETLGDWGVRYRIDWWLSGSAPVPARVLWVLVGAVVIGAAVAPFVWVRPKFVQLLRARDRAWLLFAAGAASVIGGYACDDLLGRDQFLPSAVTKSIEESLELLGVTLFALGVALHERLSLGEREALAARRLGVGASGGAGSE